MTNEEIKKKICKIIADNYLPKEMPDRLEDYKLYRFKRAAEALIAAGFGDVESWEISDADKEQSSINYYCEMREWKDKCKEAEHRAEVAEKALKKFAENITCEDCPFFSDCASSEKMEDLMHSNYCFAEYLKQAEKELAEENDGKKEV